MAYVSGKLRSSQPFERWEGKRCHLSGLSNQKWTAWNFSGWSRVSFEVGFEGIFLGD
jgi:hypothetical protein